MEYELVVRLGFFVGLFALFAVLENWLPRRAPTLPRMGRWRTNWSLVALDTLTLRLLALAMPLLAAGAAIDAASIDVGLFNRLEWTVWVEILLAVLVLDFAVWLQHLVTHKVPILWRFHRVHHSDRDMDVTTAIRFHPVEIALSMVLKIGLVYLLGPSAWAVIAFEVLLNGTALFNHTNLDIPRKIDSTLRLFLVTPDMHRIHHSNHRVEHDSNYGFSISLWDRLFRTYTDTPRDGHIDMTIGLEWQDDKPTRLGWTLLLPFFRK